MNDRRAVAGEHQMLAVLLVLVLVAIVVGIEHRTTAASGIEAQLAGMRADIVHEKEFSREVFLENQDLREANRLLRERILTLSANLSFVQEQVLACVERAPQLEGLFGEVSSLRNRVLLSDIEFTADAVTLNVGDLAPGVIAPSDSMLPLLHEGTIVLEQTPQGTADIFLGDIIIFEAEGTRIIHRVVKIGWDEQGWFATTRGDNNSQDDPYEVRFEQVRGIVVGIIY